MRCANFKIWGILLIGMGLLNTSPAASAQQTTSMTQQAALLHFPDLQATAAYKQYQMRPQSELSKIIFLIDLYRDSDIQVIFNGIENPSDVALSYARKYIGENYHREAANEWIKKHAYRAPDSGEIIYIKSSDGNVIPLRDLLLEQLNRLS